MKLGIAAINALFLCTALPLCMGTTVMGQQNAPPDPASPGNATLQEESPGQRTFQLQVQSNLVLVRVAVRDKSGEPVHGLKRDDFRLFDQGKEQTISHFEEVSPSSPSPPSTAPTAAATPTAVAGSERRYIAFYFDEFNSSEANLVQARDASDHYLETGLRPNEFVAIFTAEKMLCDFTSDPKKIHDALMQLHASARGPANEHLCPDLSDYQAYQILQTNDMEGDAWRVAIAEAKTCPVAAFSGPANPLKPSPAELQPIRMLAQRIVDQAQGLTSANLGQFEKVVRYIGQAPGQRSVVLVSPGFLSQSGQYTLDRIIDRALRDQVVINSLGPRGLALLMRESNASANTTILPDPRASLARYHLDASKEFVGADVLAEVADGTGGEFFHSDNDLKAGFAALTEDAPHYILAFSPQNVKWDGKFHRLKVTFNTTENGRTIEARRGYFAVHTPVSSEQVGAANNAPLPQPASGSTEEAPKPPVPPQPEINRAARTPQPPSLSAPALGPSLDDSPVTEANNAETSTAPPDSGSQNPPGMGVVTPEKGSLDDRMPDPTQGLIRVDLTVTDTGGTPVLGLAENDFRLFDNDRRQKVVTFQAHDGDDAQPANSHEVIFVLDELNMVPNNAKIIGAKRPDKIDEAAAQEKLDYEAAVREVKAFLRANGGRLREPTMVYRLTADGLFATYRDSMNGNELADEVENPAMQRRIWSPSEVEKDIQDMTKGGPVSWRITHSLVALGSIAIEERRKSGRKLLFWLGNGWQIEKRRAAGLTDFSIELLTRIREARINLWGASEWPLYDASGNAVAVANNVYDEFLHGPKTTSDDLSYLALPVLAARCGGGMLDVARNLAARISERAKEEGNYYSLTFDPPQTNAIDEYHHLKLEIGKPDLTAHIFNDYYDEPVFYDQPADKRPVTVKQLKDVIANGRDEKDLAQQLDGLELTQRLSSVELATLEKQVHGRKSREAFEVVADESTFLAPPADEIPASPKPDMAMQQEIVSRMVSYINTAVPSLPDLLATRTTVQYHEPESKAGQTWKTAGPDESLREGETATASIRFHDGKERVQSKSVKNAPDRPGTSHLETVGTFGPILATVMVAATSAHSKIEWDRWEQSENGQLAVFRYHVPEPTSLFTAEFCCLAYDFDSVAFKQPSPFHGEITVNPSTGAIMRLTIQADLAWRLPLERSDVMVEYAPIIRGPRTFICPLRSVSISRQRRTVAIDEWGEGFKVYGPFETLLNEMRFEKYRIFGSTYRILPGFSEVPK